LVTIEPGRSLLYSSLPRTVWKHMAWNAMIWKHQFNLSLRRIEFIWSLHLWLYKIIALKRRWNLLGGCKKGSFKKIRTEEECAQLCWFQVAWCCSELSIVYVEECKILTCQDVETKKVRNCILVHFMFQGVLVGI